MKLNQLFEDISVDDLKYITNNLNRKLYQNNKTLQHDNMIKLEIPTDAHFMDKLIQRQTKANITLKEIEKLLIDVKVNPNFNCTKEITNLSRKSNIIDTTIIAQNPEKLIIPLVVKPNKDCVNSVDNSSIGKDKNGKIVPKNIIVTKTIFRKGVRD